MTAYAYADRRRFQKDRRRAALIFIAPLMILWGLFLILPILQAAWYSLTDWDGLEASWNLSLIHISEPTRRS